MVERNQRLKFIGGFGNCNSGLFGKNVKQNAQAKKKKNRCQKRKAKYNHVLCQKRKAKYNHVFLGLFFVFTSQVFLHHILVHSNHYNGNKHSCKKLFEKIIPGAPVPKKYFGSTVRRNPLNYFCPVKI